MNYLKFLFTLIITISSFNITADESEDLKQDNNEAKVENTEGTEDEKPKEDEKVTIESCLLYTSPSPRDVEESRMPSSA